MLDRTSPSGRTRWEADPESGCWVWQMAVDRHGYGVIAVDRLAKRAHRVSYESAAGPVPEGMDLDHLCRNRRCVNPEHLEPTTRSVNSQRGAQARLTPDIVRQIRESDLPDRALARLLGVGKSTVQAARRGVTWKEIV